VHSGLDGEHDQDEAEGDREHGPSVCRAEPPPAPDEDEQREAEQERESRGTCRIEGVSGRGGAGTRLSLPTSSINCPSQQPMWTAA